MRDFIVTIKFENGFRIAGARFVGPKKPSSRNPHFVVTCPVWDGNGIALTDNPTEAVKSFLFQKFTVAQDCFGHRTRLHKERLAAMQAAGECELSFSVGADANWTAYTNPQNPD